MKSEKNIKPLSIWKLRAKDWRVENGFTTPEWEQYIAWSQFRHFIALMSGYGVGVIVGLFIAIIISLLS